MQHPPPLYRLLRPNRIPDNRITPGEDFKGTTRTADGLECTLGRLLFNIFEPVGLPVLLTEIQNVIGPRPENADPTDESAYKICTRWVSRDGSGLKGRTELEGLCSEDPSNPNRILVVLNKGSIRPDEGQELESWSEVIGVKDAEADKEKGPLSIIKEGFAKLVLKVISVYSQSLVFSCLTLVRERCDAPHRGAHRVDGAECPTSKCDVFSRCCPAPALRFASLIVRLHGDRR